MLRIFSIVVINQFVTRRFALGQDPARMDQLVQSYVTNGDFMGSVLVARGEEILLSNGFGLANAEWNRPDATSDKYQQSLVAAAIIRISCDCRIDLNGTPIRMSEKRRRP